MDSVPVQTAPPPAEVPIYTDLVQSWASAGRTVPGHDDQEWIALVGRPAWPGH